MGGIKMKKLISIACSVAVICTAIFAGQMSASSAIRPLYRGDVDCDGRIDIRDATMVQKGLANVINLTKRELFTADVNGDGETDIQDATLIQKRTANIIKEFDAPDVFDHTVHFENFSADFEDGKAMAGVPVTFTITACGGIEPFSYEFTIDGKVVQERSENNTLVYTFDKAGDYRIEVKYFNIFDEYETHISTYTVVEPYTSDDPVITSIHTNRWYTSFADTNTKVTAYAIFGTAPYQFSFNLDNGALVQDFSESNEFLIEDSLSLGEHNVEVTVKDSNGKITKENYRLVSDYILIG